MARLSRLQVESSEAEHSDASSTNADTPAACDIFNTTFSLYRVSPLFVLAPLLASKLEVIGRRLRETLVGDVVRGIELNGDDQRVAAAGSAGVLQTVTVEWVPVASVLQTSRPGLQIKLHYENAVCSALLLPDTVADVHSTVAATSETFLRLPLLLVRMPALLKDVVVGFLSSTFDCQIGPLHLGSEDLVQCWDSWAASTNLFAADPLTYDAVLTLGVCIPRLEGFSNASKLGATDSNVAKGGPGIKTIDVIISRRDFPLFLKASQETGGAGNDTRRSYLDALAHYVDHHLALDMKNPIVRIVRIACGGFVLGESRVKILATSDTLAEENLPIVIAHRQLFGYLMKKASGEQ